MLKINIQKQLGNLLLDLDLAIPNKGVTALFGLSGSGKTSIINLVSGLIHPEKGEISLNNKVLVDTEKSINLPPNKRNIGYVFQDARLFPHYRVKGNLTYGMSKQNKEQAVRNFEKITKLLGISHLLKRYPVTLSGGEKQRVAIGRALLTTPDLLLMDEPLSALDIPRKKELLDYLEVLSNEINIPIVYVTHSLDELLRLANKVALIENGKVLAFDDLEVIWQSELFDRWQKNSEHSTVLSLPIVEYHAEYKMLALQLGEQLLWVNKALEKDSLNKQNLRVCVYSKDVSITLSKPQETSIRNILLAQIKEIIQEQNHVDIRLRIGKNTIWATISKWSFDELKLIQNQQVYIQIKAVGVVR